jgi:mannose-6-phosphate isomerase-like protein (cupin superfamily)
MVEHRSVHVRANTCVLVDAKSRFDAPVFRKDIDTFLSNSFYVADSIETLLQ